MHVLLLMVSLHIFLEDSGYPLLQWLIGPHKGPGHLTLAEALYNRKVRKDRRIMENAFGILKQTFRELLVKLDLSVDLSVTFLPDVITCCAILHNVLLGQFHEDVEHFMEVLWTEGLEGEVVDEERAIPNFGPEIGGGDNIGVGSPCAVQKRTEVGIYLALQWNIAV